MLIIFFFLGIKYYYHGERKKKQKHVQCNHINGSYLLREWGKMF